MLGSELILKVPAQSVAGRAHIRKLFMPTTSPISVQEQSELVSYLTRRMRNRVAAEDVAQDAIVRLLIYMEKESVSNPRALIYRIADNLMLNSIRDAKRNAELERAIHVESPPGPEDLFAGREQDEIFLTAVNSLPRKRREVIIRRILHGESHKQIAAAMKLSTASVEKHLTRAIASVRCQVEQRNRRGEAN